MVNVSKGIMVISEILRVTSYLNSKESWSFLCLLMVGLCIGDIHLIRRHELFLAMMVLASTLQVFRSIKPAIADVYMLLVKCTHLQNLCFPV